MSGYYFCLAIQKSTGKLGAYSIPHADFPPENSVMETYLEKNRGKIIDNLMTYDKNGLIEQMAKAGVEVPKGNVQKIDLANLLTDFLLKDTLDDDDEQEDIKQFSVKYFLEEIRKGEGHVVEAFINTILHMERPSEEWRSIDQTALVLLNGIREEFTGFMDEFYCTLRRKFIQTQLNKGKETNDENFIDLVIDVYDKRLYLKDGEKMFRNAFTLKVDLNQSLVSLNLAFAEHVRDENFRGLRDMDWMQVPFFNGFRMSHVIQNLASYGLKHGDKVEVHVLLRGDERIAKIFEEVFTNGCLNTSYKTFTCIGENQVKPCHLFIDVPMQNGVKKLVFFFTKKTDGKALFEALVEFNDDWGQDAISMTWAGTTSKVDAFDNLYAYFGSSSTIKLTPKIVGGGLNKGKFEKTKRVDGYKDAFKKHAEKTNQSQIDFHPDFQLIERKVQSFIATVETDFDKAVLDALYDLPLDAMEAVSAKLSSEGGGSTELKVSRAVIDLFNMGNMMKAKDSVENIHLTASNIVLYGILKSCKGNTMSLTGIKGLIEKAMNQKIGAMSATTMTDWAVAILAVADG